MSQAPSRSPGVSARAAAAARWATRRTEDLQARSRLVATMLEAGRTDRDLAGALLAGGVAFRIFLWLLPAALFTSGLVGLLRPSGSAAPDEVARKLGLGAAVASTVRQTTEHSNSDSLMLMAVGAVLALYAATSLLRALRITHALAWREPVKRRPHLLRDAAILSGVLYGGFLLQSAISYLHAQEGARTLLVVPVQFAMAAGLWLGVSVLLPHARADVRALVPGALLFATGLLVLHVATTYYFAPRLTKAPTLYGSLGAAATVLAWLFLLARLIVASAFLNAALARGPEEPDPVL